VRELTLKTGKISLLYPPLDIDCAIFDISEGLACILLSNGAKVPECFNLVIDPGQDIYSCKVAWKSGNKIGVSFQSRLKD
jgi:hypothetical protein